MGTRSHHHVLVVSYPGQGHVNPLLRLAKRLASKGLFVTFSSTQVIGNMIQKSTKMSDPGKPVSIGQGHLRFEFFSDGWDDDDPRHYDLGALLHQLDTIARDSFTQLIKKQAESDRRVTCVINNQFVRWASDVATDLGIPFAVLWVQSCAAYSAYYHYFHNLASFPTPDLPDLSVEIPGLPTLQSDEIPSFLHPSTPPRFLLLKNTILGQFKNLEKAICVLVDSFEELEQEAIRLMLNLIPIKPVGPLFKFTAGDTTINSVSGDLWVAADNCMDWLDTKPPASVVYVSFGSIAFLSNEQMEEIARGLLNSGHFFLWVVKPPPKEYSIDAGRVPEGFIEEAGGKGLVVHWCPQDRVLAHPSVACFVTHCGWNSSMEILSSGVPVVAAPHWGDQVTNAKYLADVYGVGVRLVHNQTALKTLSRTQVEKCIFDVTRGPKAGEIKKNALKWKKAAEEAGVDGGSSEKNLLEFVDSIRVVSFK